jgi:hypothetical protein
MRWIKRWSLNEQPLTHVYLLRLRWMIIESTIHPTDRGVSGAGAHEDLVSKGVEVLVQNISCP